MLGDNLRRFFRPRMVEPEPSPHQFRHDERPRVSGSLFTEKAIDQLVDQLFGMADPDAVLRKAGKTRVDLRALEGDDEISAAMETRLNAVLATPWGFKAMNRQARFVKDVLEPHLEGIVIGAWNANPYGYSVQEAVYERLGSGRYGLECVVERPFEWFRPKPSGELYYLRRGGALIGELVDTHYKFFLTVRRGSYRNPMGEALLSRLYWPWFLRSAGWRFWSRFLERFGAPLLIGKTHGDKDAMAQALAKAVQSGAMGIGAQDDVDAVSPTSNGEAFERFQDRVDRRIQKVVLGQTLTTEANSKGGGSLALGQVQDGVRQDRKDADLRMIVKTVQAVVNAITWLNFPNAEPPVFEMDSGRDLGIQRAERDAKLVGAKIVRLTPKYLLERYDFDEGDIEVPDPEEQQPPEGEEGPESGQEPPQEGAQAHSCGHPSHQFASGRARFTAAQQAVEDLGDEALAMAGDPIDPAAIRRAIREASDPDDLVERLSALFDSIPDQSAYREAMERALFAADVLGYAHNEIGD